ncbi:hypothetical protein, variant [Exophiala mesophila]|nr:hypothetical protein, variant [Exophiala mesophila]KIV94154.1 hypothetical protein, variant [Exophiala mesophila]
MEYMTRAIELDSWQKSQVSLSENRLVRMRIDYFEDRAAELDPPMEEHILVRMAAYHKCLRVQAAPTERSWKTLQDKILPYRAQAEIVEKYRMDMRSLSVLVRTPAKVLHARLRDHRWDRRIDPPTQPEQDYVLRLARREFQKCIEAKVADADLLLRCLQQVFDEHAKNPNPPQGLNYNGDIGPYLLSLDDARMIVEEVIEKQIPKESVRGMAVLQSLRCRGCRRVDFVRSFSFVEAFEHILESHSIYVGKGLEFWRFAIPYGDPDRWSSLSMRDNSRFPWYTAAWPRCLPLVPGYYDISTLEDWHPSSTETLLPRSARPSRSLFEQLTPKGVGISPSEMGSNMVHAAKILRGVRLESECQMAIMLKYAGDLHRQTGAPDPPVSVLADALEGIREANSRIDLRFRCNACLGAVIGHRSVKNTKTKLAIEKLLVHWQDKHGDLGQSWMSTLMVLPTEVEVTRQVEESDRKLEAEKQAMQARNAKLANAIKKRPKLKEQVVMNARTAHEAVDELFIAVDAS